MHSDEASAHRSYFQISGRRSVTGKKISMWIDAGIHAREWIAPATAMYIVHEVRKAPLPTGNAEVAIRLEPSCNFPGRAH